jgi:putative N6-adenine-specific DNA methylase
MAYNYNLIATCKLGLESVLKDELHHLGYQNLNVSNGEISFMGDDKAIVRCNMWLRTAERVLLRLASFPATTFDTLFEEVSKIDWGEILPKDARIRVMDKCVMSQLISGRTVQSIVKKAIVDSLQKKYRISWLPEDGAEFKIHADIIRDLATISMDSSGDGLHKRGYRAFAGEAPLRETIASAMIMLSNWKTDKPLYDPLCGSGTIPIEAALIGANIAPGLNRAFAAEQWPFIESDIWKEVADDAISKIKKTELIIRGSDIDDGMIRLAKSNAEKAGVDKYIVFEKRALEDFGFESPKGTIIVNPPYGERLEDVEAAEKIYETMGRLFQKRANWSYFIISPHQDFERLFGRKANKNRKIYNGKIKCYYYSYL